jgi:hypothetical protein
MLLMLYIFMVYGGGFIWHCAVCFAATRFIKEDLTRLSDKGEILMIQLSR